jgi:hypothetical protein
MRSGIEVQVLWGMFLTLYILQPEWKIPKDQIKLGSLGRSDHLRTECVDFIYVYDSMVVAELVMFARRTKVSLS